MNFIYPFTNTTSKLVLSTKVNKKLYDQIDLEKFKRAYPIKYKPDSLEQLTKTTYWDEEFLLNTNAYIQYNAKYTRDILIKEMCTHIPETIKNMEKKIKEKELTSQVENISVKPITEGSSKYAKKKFKQHNNELASKKR